MKKANTVGKKMILGSTAAGLMLTVPYSSTAYAHVRNQGHMTMNIEHIFYSGSTGQAPKYLQKEYHPGLKVDGIFGPKSHIAALRSQPSKKHSQVNSMTESKTSSPSSDLKDRYIPSRTIQFGDQGKAIRSVQKKLKNLGDYKDKIDGIFGIHTKKAVKKFQADHNLLVDGIVGPQTRAALFQIQNTTKDFHTKVQQSSNHSGILSTAKNLIGTPYQWGGTTSEGFDCSGFVQHVFKKNGIKLPRTANDIWNYGIPVDQPKKGDLVFFQTYKPGPSHVGIYIGSGQFLSATNDGVKKSSMRLSYWHSRYLGAERIVQHH